LKAAPLCCAAAPLCCAARMPFLPAALGGAFPFAALGGAAMFASAARAPFMGEFSGALDMANRGR
jgi:hypothetical protein